MRRVHAFVGGVVVASVLVFTPGSVEAAEPAAAEQSATAEAPTKGEGGWRFRIQPQFRAIPRGLDTRFEVGFRRPLWRDKDSVLFNGTYIEAELIARLSPASLHPGVAIKVVPIAPLELTAAAFRLTYFGNFGSLFEYEGVDANWGPEQRSTASSDDLGRFEQGWAAKAKASLRLKFDRALLISDFGHMWLSAPNVAAGNAWYESSSDMLVAREDHVQTINVNAGWLLWGGPSDDEFLLLALRWEGWRTLRSEQQRQITSLLTMWRPGWLRERHLTFALLTGVYAQDPYRTGQPYIAGFAQFNWMDEGAR